MAKKKESRKTATRSGEEFRDEQASDSPMLESLADTSSPEDAAEEIRRQAYELYQSRGDLSGNEVDDWLEAERLVRSRRNEDGGRTPGLPN